MEYFGGSPSDSAGTEAAPAGGPSMTTLDWSDEQAQARRRTAPVATGVWATGQQSNNVNYEPRRARITHDATIDWRGATKDKEPGWRGAAEAAVAKSPLNPSLFVGSPLRTRNTRVPETMNIDDWGSGSTTPVRSAGPSHGGAPAPHPPALAALAAFRGSPLRGPAVKLQAPTTSILDRPSAPYLHTDASAEATQREPSFAPVAFASTGTRAGAGADAVSDEPWPLKHELLARTPLVGAAAVTRPAIVVPEQRAEPEADDALSPLSRMVKAAVQHPISRAILTPETDSSSAPSARSEARYTPPLSPPLPAMQSHRLAAEQPAEQVLLRPQPTRSSDSGAYTLLAALPAVRSNDGSTGSNTATSHPRAHDLLAMSPDTSLVNSIGATWRATARVDTLTGTKQASLGPAAAATTKAASTTPTSIVAVADAVLGAARGDVSLAASPVLFGAQNMRGSSGVAEAGGAAGARLAGPSPTSKGDSQGASESRADMDGDLSSPDSCRYPSPTQQRESSADPTGPETLAWSTPTHNQRSTGSRAGMETGSAGKSRSQQGLQQRLVRRSLQPEQLSLLSDERQSTSAWGSRRGRTDSPRQSICDNPMFVSFGQEAESTAVPQSPAAVFASTLGPGSLSKSLGWPVSESLPAKPAATGLTPLFQNLQSKIDTRGRRTAVRSQTRTTQSAGIDGVGATVGMGVGDGVEKEQDWFSMGMVDMQSPASAPRRQRDSHGKGSASRARGSPAAAIAPDSVSRSVASGDARGLIRSLAAADASAASVSKVRVDDSPRTSIRRLCRSHDCDNTSPSTGSSASVTRHRRRTPLMPIAAESGEDTSPADSVASAGSPGGALLPSKRRSNGAVTSVTPNSHPAEPLAAAAVAVPAPAVTQVTDTASAGAEPASKGAADVSEALAAAAAPADEDLSRADQSACAAAARQPPSSPAAKAVRTDTETATVDAVSDDDTQREATDQGEQPAAVAGTDSTTDTTTEQPGEGEVQASEPVHVEDTNEGADGGLSGVASNLSFKFALAMDAAADVDTTATDTHTKAVAAVSSVASAQATVCISAHVAQTTTTTTTTPDVLTEVDGLFQGTPMSPAAADSAAAPARVLDAAGAACDSPDARGGPVGVNSPSLVEGVGDSEGAVSGAGAGAELRSMDDRSEFSFASYAGESSAVKQQRPAGAGVELSHTEAEPPASPDWLAAFGASPEPGRTTVSAAGWRPVPPTSPKSVAGRAPRVAAAAVEAAAAQQPAPRARAQQNRPAAAGSVAEFALTTLKWLLMVLLLLWGLSAVAKMYSSWHSSSPPYFSGPARVRDSRVSTAAQRHGSTDPVQHLPATESYKGLASDIDKQDIKQRPPEPSPAKSTEPAASAQSQPEQRPAAAADTGKTQPAADAVALPGQQDVAECMFGRAALLQAAAQLLQAVANNQAAPEVMLATQPAATAAAAAATVTKDTPVPTTTAAPSKPPVPQAAESSEGPCGCGAGAEGTYTAPAAATQPAAKPQFTVTETVVRAETAQPAASAAALRAETAAPSAPQPIVVSTTVKPTVVPRPAVKPAETTSEAAETGNAQVDTSGSAAEYSVVRVVYKSVVDSEPAPTPAPSPTVEAVHTAPAPAPAASAAPAPTVQPPPAAPAPAPAAPDQPAAPAPAPAHPPAATAKPVAQPTDAVPSNAVPNPTPTTPSASVSAALQVQQPATAPSRSSVWLLLATCLLPFALLAAQQYAERMGIDSYALASTALATLSASAVALASDLAEGTEGMPWKDRAAIIAGRAARVAADGAVAGASAASALALRLFTAARVYVVTHYGELHARDLGATARVAVSQSWATVSAVAANVVAAARAFASRRSGGDGDDAPMGEDAGGEAGPSGAPPPPPSAKPGRRYGLRSVTSAASTPAAAARTAQQQQQAEHLYQQQLQAEVDDWQAERARRQELGLSAPTPPHIPGRLLRLRGGPPPKPEYDNEDAPPTSIFMGMSQQRVVLTKSGSVFNRDDLLKAVEDAGREVDDEWRQEFGPNARR